MNPFLRLRLLAVNLLSFPWMSTFQTLRERLREDRLALSASSLTFTTTIALVPLVTVALAVFTAFPMFAKFQEVLQRWLVESLIPDNIARQVLGYLTQFAGKANRLGLAGLAVLFATALSLVFTIDRTLNSIWRVPRQRPLGQRLLIYWAAITVGPLVLAASLSMTSYVVSASGGLVDAMPKAVRLLLDMVEFGFIVGALAATYHYVPNTQVHWRHAVVGGVFAALGIEAAKKLLTLYLSVVPTYSVVYGAFATFPILLVWIYLAWLTVLLGAVIAAYLPSLLSGTARRKRLPGWRFRLGVEILQLLLESRLGPAHGLNGLQLSTRLHVDLHQIQEILQVLLKIGWVGQLNETSRNGPPRFLILVDPQKTLAAPLLDQLLLQPEGGSQMLWKNAHLDSLRLLDILPRS